MSFLSRTARPHCVSALACLLLGLVPALVTAQSSHLVNDQFVRDQIDRKKFENGGEHFISGSMAGDTDYVDKRVQEAGQVSVIPTSSQRIGAFVLETAVLQGQYSWVGHRPSYHPWQEHAPFDSIHTSKAHAETSSKTSSETVDLSWTQNQVHPADGYDPPQGGGYPPPNPLGAIDRYTTQIGGVAQGMFLLSDTEREASDLAPQVRELASAGKKLAKVYGGGPKAAIAAAQAAAKTAEQNYYKTLAQYQQAMRAQTRNSLGQFMPLTGYQKGSLPAAKAAWDSLAQEASATAKAWSGFAGAMKWAGTAGKVIQFGADVIMVSAAHDATEFSEAVNSLVRDVVTTATGSAGAALGTWAGALGGAPGGLVGSALGGVFGGLVGYLLGSIKGGELYDTYFKQAVTDWAASIYPTLTQTADTTAQQALRAGSEAAQAALGDPGSAQAAAEAAAQAQRASIQTGRTLIGQLFLDAMTQASQNATQAIDTAIQALQTAVPVPPILPSGGGL